ncbi:MAG TPA: site-2 protease family protein [Kofleriaceae bacterium]|jgi:regulator of sigma E protease
MYYVFAILSLGFLIVVHEGGHYFVARWCGMRIERFSIGFGPGILKRRSKKTGTTFQLAPIPFGGFVEIRGMNIAEDVDPDDLAAYPNRPAWQRFITIFAGPATNYISAVVLAFGLFAYHGVESSWRWYGVSEVRTGYDAFGKLEPGDRILAVDHDRLLAEGIYTGPDGQVLKADPGNGLVAHVNAKNGAPVTLTITRHGETRDVVITPTLAGVMVTSGEADGPTEIVAFGPTPMPVVRDVSYDCVPSATAARFHIPDGDVPAALRCRASIKVAPYLLLGIAPSEQPDYLKIGVIASLRAALEYPVDKTQEIAAGLYGIVRGTERADPGGPKRIFDEFAKAWRLGWVTGVELLMLLSVYLGLFNLFPLPALDGGRLAFLGYEMVTRRRANPRIEAMVHMGGIMVLGVVMILVTLNDFHLFS